MQKKVSNKEIFSRFCHDLKIPLTVMKCNLDLLDVDSMGGLKETGKFKSLMNKEIDKIVKLIAGAQKNISME